MKYLIIALLFASSYSIAQWSHEVSLSHYLDGEWYACDTYTTKSNGDTISKTTNNGCETSYIHNPAFGYKMELQTCTHEVIRREQYIINTNGRHELRRNITIHSNYPNNPKENYIGSVYITLTDDGCPIAQYDAITHRLISEYHNDSLCQPISHGSNEYQYDSDGRLIRRKTLSLGNTPIIDTYDTNGNVISRLTVQKKEFYSYHVDPMGRTLYVSATEIDIKTNKTKQYEQHYKYFTQNNTTYKCVVDNRGAPILREQVFFHPPANFIIQTNNGKDATFL